MKIPSREAGRAVVSTVDAHNLVTAVPGVIEAVTNLHTATDQLRKTVTGDRGILLTGASSKQLYNGAASAKLTHSAGRLLGWSLASRDGTAYEIRLHDGHSIEGDVLAIAAAAAGAVSVPAWFGPGGIGFGAGLFAEVVSGNVIGSFYFGSPTS